ncbi:hypothetical protein Glove_117g382 [Diversispora epigaea]|uniref:Uncharacterized protein n=1 Tax=Diversispora epigaea TaxID=1348612 RepID=A0A397J8V2_9GLOM|nr:hypothetical protein Glove_117g382 [Diversispora epigaea]
MRSKYPIQISTSKLNSFQVLTRYSIISSELIGDSSYFTHIYNKIELLFNIINNKFDNRSNLLMLGTPSKSFCPSDDY